MAVENGVQNAELGYLLFPFEQYSNLAGKPLVGGHMEIYEAGTDTKYISYSNWDGAENPFRIPIPNDGRITVLADTTKTFDCYLYDSYNNLVCSRLNVQANVPGNISIKGADTILKNTDGTLDIYLRTLGNNVREYTVNTHNKVLDVQEPLYFVENSNTATVIGFSGDNYATTADLADKMDISKLEYNEDGEISAYDGSAFAGQGGAGDPEVNDLVHSNSATWNDVSAKLDTTAFSTVSGDFLTAIPDNYATKDYVQSSVSSKLDSTAFSTVSGSFLTAHQSLDGLMSASLLGMSGNTITSYNNMPFPLGGEGDAEVNQIVHANSGDWNNVSAKLDTTAFSTVSGDFLTAHQDLSQYAKTADLTAYQEKGDYYSASNPSGFLTKNSADTLYQPAGDYAYASALDGKVDTSSFTAFSSTTNEKIEYISGALSGTYELSAGSGIDITDYPNEQKTVISVTAQGGNPEVEAEVIAHSADWNTVAEKLDTTAFSTVSGDFLTAHQDISNLMPKSESANFYPMTGNPSGFLTAHQDLSDYQTIAGMTAYQEAGDYLSATESANYYPMTGNPSGFLTEVPAGTLNESAFGYDSNNKISGYNGSAFAGEGGGEFPQSASEAVDYITATSGDINSTIDNVSSNSGAWGGSALPVSAGPGVKISLQNDTLVFSTDETVLWESSTGTSTYNTPNIVLSDNPFNYEYLEIYCSYQGPFQVSKKVQTSYIIGHNNEFGIGDFCGDSPSTDALYIRDTWFNVNTSAISAYKATQAVVMNNAISQQGSSQYAYVTLYKVIGINHNQN